MTKKSFCSKFLKVFHIIQYALDEARDCEVLDKITKKRQLEIVKDCVMNEDKTKDRSDIEKTLAKIINKYLKITGDHNG